MGYLNLNHLPKQQILSLFSIPIALNESVLTVFFMLSLKLITMATTAAIISPALGHTQSARKPVSWSNLLVGASMNLFQGQLPRR